MSKWGSPNPLYPPSQQIKCRLLILIWQLLMASDQASSPSCRYQLVLRSVSRLYHNVSLYLRNKSQQNALFYSQFVSVSHLYMFQASLFLIIRRCCSVYTAVGIRGGTQKFPELLKKLFKVFVQVWNFSSFEVLPLRLDAAIPASLPMLETLSKICNRNAVRGRQRFAHKCTDFLTDHWRGLHRYFVQCNGVLVLLDR